MAVHHLGECVCSDLLARRIDAVLMVCANFGHFAKTDGSLRAIIGFMTCMWLLIFVVLLGTKLHAEVEHEQCAERNWPTRAANRTPRENATYAVDPWC